MAQVEQELSQKDRRNKEYEHEITQLGQLVERQAKLLEAQDLEFNQLVEENEKIQLELEAYQHERMRTAQHIEDMTDNFRELSRKLSRHSEDWQVLMEL